MACKTCGVSEAAEVCLHCGHEFCPTHRDQASGLPACFDCIKSEAERKRGRVAATAAKAIGTPVTNAKAVQVKVEATAPAPLPEPRSNSLPLFAGLLAAVPGAAYVYWFAGKLVVENDWAGWTQPLAAIAFGSFVLAGVFAIVKSR